VKIGTSLHRLSSLGFDLISQESHGEGLDLATASCSNAIFFAHGIELGALMADGHVERVDVLSPGISTAEGIHVGSTEDDARRTYKTRLSVWKTTPSMGVNRSVSFGGENTHVLLVFSKDHQSLLFLESDGVRVLGMHVGPSKVFWSQEGNAVEVPPCSAVIELGGWQNMQHP
jgi:hypothetical protein